MRDVVVPAADVLTPNQFELEYLVGRTIETVDDLLAAADALRARGPQTVLVTSVQTNETPADSVQMAVVGDDGAWIVTTPLLPMYVAGSGDATAAIFFARLMTSGPAQALAATASSIYAVMERTHEMGSREILLVDAQDAIADPQMQFEVTRLR